MLAYSLRFLNADGTPQQEFNLRVAPLIHQEHCQVVQTVAHIQVFWSVRFF